VLIFEVIRLQVVKGSGSEIGLGRMSAIMFVNTASKHMKGIYT
jgi:hypothetical protein